MVDKKVHINNLLKLPNVEIAELLSKLDGFELARILMMFPSEKQGQIFAELPITMQIDFAKSLSKKKFSVIFENMPSDNRADLFQHLTQQEQATVIPFLSKQIREDVIHLSSYPPETAGGIMSTDFSTINLNMTCIEAINKVRTDSPSKKSIYYVYVVDEDMKLEGFVTLKDIILAEPDTLVYNVLHTEFVFAYVDDDREEVAKKIEKYDIVAIPVLNEDLQLMGTVSHDDAIDIIRAEHTEDLEKFMGMVPDKSVVDYPQTTVWQHFKKRVVWIASLSVVGLISGIIIHSYEEALSTLLILALYMPMIADTGGNAGSQAATVVVRALALGQISVKNWFRVLLKETKISFLISIVLGVIAFSKIMFLSWETEVPEPFSLFYIALGITLALCMQVVTATIVGSLLPIIVKRFGGDPAVAASPAITTIVDITGLLIYFGIATLLFF